MHREEAVRSQVCNMNIGFERRKEGMPRSVGVNDRRPEKKAVAAKAIAAERVKQYSDRLSNAAKAIKIRGHCMWQDRKHVQLDLYEWNGEHVKTNSLRRRKNNLYKRVGIR